LSPVNNQKSRQPPANWHREERWQRRVAEQQALGLEALEWLRRVEEEKEALAVECAALRSREGAAAVSRCFLACNGSPCLRPCVHGASIGGGGGGGDGGVPWLLAP
jgi:hypothetical protein